jgi:hypothetical protein
MRFYGTTTEIRAYVETEAGTFVVRPNGVIRLDKAGTETIVDCSQYDPLDIAIVYEQGMAAIGKHCRTA